MMIMIYAIAIGLLCALLSFLCLDPETVQSVRFLRAQDGTAEVYHRFQRKPRLALSGLFGLLTAAAAWRMVQNASNAATLISTALALVCLSGSGCTDLTEHRIPNLFPLLLTLGALGLLSVQFLLEPDLATAQAMNCLFAGAISLFCFVMLSFLSRHGVGAGDIKLVSSLGLLVGLRSLYWCILCTMVLCAVGAAYLLLRRKKH